MVTKNEAGLERVFRICLGFGLITLGFWISGNYWLSYTTPIYQIHCWEWRNFITHACLVERGLAIAFLGTIPILTGIIGWCPLKAIFKFK